MMGMLKQGLSAAGSAANTVANVGKAVAQGVVGSVVSAAEAGRVTVRLNQTDYVSGDVLEGVVEVDAKVPLIAKGIDIRITGYEKTEWHDRTERVLNPDAPPAERMAVPVYTRNRGKKTIFDNKVRVHDLNNSMLTPGKHCFPFKWQLPAGLSGSFSDRVPLFDVATSAEFKERDLVDDFADSDDEDSSARYALLGVVHYKIKAVFDVVDCLWMKDMSGKTAVVVRPRMDASSKPAEAEASQEISSCGCMKQGTCTLCARFDKIAYTAGETADVRVDMNNESSAKLHTSVSLQRTLSLRGQGGAERKVVESVASQQYDQFGKGKSADRRMPLRLDGPKIKPSTAATLVHCSFEYILSAGPVQLRMPVIIDQTPGKQQQQQPGSPMSPGGGAVAPL